MARRTVAIIVNGAPRAGKDTVVKYMGDKATELGWDVSALSTIDPIRAMLRNFGFPVERKGPKERKLLADVGNAVEEYNSYRTSEATDFLITLDLALDQRNRLCFIHLREPELIQKMKDNLPSHIKLITVVVRSPAAEVAIPSNSADANVLDFNYDWMIANTSTLGDLYDACTSTISEILNAG